MSHFHISFPPSRLCFQTSATDSLSSRFRFKKSAVLCCTFLLGVNCWQNNTYSWFTGSEPSFLFFSDCFRHLRKRICSHRLLNNMSCLHIPLLTVLLQYFLAICHGREVDVFVMLMYYTFFRHNILAFVRRSAVFFGSVLPESSVIHSFSIQSKPIKDSLSLSSRKFSIVFFSYFFCLSVFLPPKSSADFQMTAKIFEAKSSAAVSVPLSHFFPTF